MKRIALLLALFALPAAAQTYGPFAEVFIGYGQSTMEGPVSGDGAQGTSCSVASGVLTVSAINNPVSAASALGSVVSGIGYPQGAPAGTLVTITATSATSGNPCNGSPCTGTNSTGTYGISNGSLSIASGTCFLAPQITTTLITPSNVNSNAFMISTSPQTGVHGLYDTLNSSNSGSSYPVLVTNWSGFTQLHEAITVYNFANGYTHTETPISSFVAQYIVATGLAQPNAVIGENMAVGGEDWAGYPTQQHLGPGGTFEWANVVSAQKYIKNTLQGSSTALSGTGFTGTGPWTYHLAGIPLRLGESAASFELVLTVTSANPPSTSSTAISTSNANPYAPLTSVANWCVVDHTQSDAFVGFISSWSAAGAITLTGNSNVNGSNGDTLWVSPCYGGYQAELKSMLAQFTASDVSDAPSPGGVPIFAQIPSSTKFGTPFTGKVFGHLVSAANAVVGLADRRMVVTGPAFECGPYQSDAVHGEPQHNAMCGAYMGKWAGWYYQGYRTAPFMMTSAQWLAPGSTSCSATYYCIRVTFQMPPSPAQNSATVATQQTLQLYTDSNIPNLTNSGFCYMDGTYPTGGSVFYKWSGGTGGCATSSSTTSITSVGLASAHGGNANQIDLVTNATSLSGITNPTVGLGMAWAPGTSNFWGAGNAYLMGHNVANQDCTKVANTGLSGDGFPNTNCNGGTGGNNYLIDFADPGFVTVGAAPLTTAW
jgi:hypothetical protein